MLLFSKPDAVALRGFLDSQARAPFSYKRVGCTSGQPPLGFDVGHRRVCLGTGAESFAAGCQALRRWEMFRLGWVELYRGDTPIEPGAAVAVVARAFGLWWLNACRIVYVIDEPGRFGFAYGTLPEHAERGEERFLVERLDDDSVWFDLYALSRPANWLVKVGYPLARRLQRRFAIDALAAMQRAVKASESHE